MIQPKQSIFKLFLALTALLLMAKAFYLIKHFICCSGDIVPGFHFILRLQINMYEFILYGILLLTVEFALVLTIIGKANGTKLLHLSLYGLLFYNTVPINEPYSVLRLSILFEIAILILINTNFFIKQDFKQRLTYGLLGIGIVLILFLVSIFAAYFQVGEFS